MAAGGRLILPRLWILSFFLLCSGCSETDLRSPSSFSAVSFDELKQRVSRTRDLAFRDEVVLEAQRKEDIRAALEKTPLEKNRNLSQLARVYARIGLLPEKTDLPKALLDLRSFREAVHYDARKKTIVVPQEALNPNLAILRSPFLADDLTRQILLTHALTHALQEQHFHWREKLQDGTEDSGLALRAVKDGDANLVGLAQLVGDPKENPQRFLDGVKSIMRVGLRIDAELPDLPELLRQKLAFSYLRGSQFVMWAYSLKGWDGVNELFSHPPLSTKQVLHPEKYYAKKDDPVEVNPWSLIRQFGSRIIVDETLGEFLIQFLLGHTLSPEEAARAAAGWGGDRFLAFEQGGRLVLAWVTAWDNREEAQEFFRSYRRALEKSYKSSFEPAQGNPETLVAMQQNDLLILLQIRENCVFFLDGMPPTSSLEIAEKLWKDLETGSAPGRLPFDLSSRYSPSFKR